MGAIHAAFYSVSGLWALVFIDSFQLVTGPKTDLWLVRTVAALITLTGLSLGVSTWRKRLPLELGLIAMGQNLVLSAVAVVYVFNGTISPIYLFDAILQSSMAVAWIVVLARNRLTGDFRSEAA